MEQNRRQTDIRMNNVETEIKELRKNLQETHDVVTFISGKITNGMTDAINDNKENIREIKNDIKIIAEWMGKTEPIITRTPAQRLSDCPFKKEITDGMKKKINWWIIGLFFALLITNNADKIFTFGKAIILKLAGA